MALLPRNVKFALLTYLALPPAVLLLRLMVWTWRIAPGLRQMVEEIATQPRVVGAVCHGNLFALLAVGRELRRRGREIVVLSSPSRDGILLEHALKLLGLRVVKGSSSKKAAAGARGLVEAVEEGAIAVLTVDGPRGPRFVPKAGALGVARLAGAVVYTASFSAGSCWRFRSWDGLYLPRPFATIDARVAVFESSGESGEEQELARLERVLRADAVAIGSPVAEERR